MGEGMGGGATDRELRVVVVPPTVGQPHVPPGWRGVWAFVQILSKHAHRVPGRLERSCERVVVYLAFIDVHAADLRVCACVRACV